VNKIKQLLLKTPYCC